MSDGDGVGTKIKTEPEKEPDIPTQPEVTKIKTSPKKKNRSSKSLSKSRADPEGDVDKEDALSEKTLEKDYQEGGRSESLTEDTRKAAEEKFAVQSNRIGGSSQQGGFSGRTKSLEDLKDMTPYGDLIVDRSITDLSNAQQGSKTRDHLYKILVIGDLGTGKTSIIKRYVHRFYTQHYRATIGVDFALKVINWDENTLIRLQLWDIAGQERYGNMTRVYYKEAVGAFVVFDVTRRNTFESVANWKSDLDNKVQLPDGSPIPCILLANKCDQQKEGIVNFPNKMKEYCQENGFTDWFETSAKDNINIDEAAKVLVEKILACDSLLSMDNKKSTDHFSLTQDSSHINRNKACSC